MSATLRICVPEATENYIANPSIRFDTTGWSAVGSTVTRTLDRARFGVAALKLVTNGLALNEGAYFKVTTLANIQDYITVSVYLRGTGRVRIRLNEQLGGQWASLPIMLTDTRWTRLEVTGRCTGKNDVRLYIETADNTPKAITFYADGAMMEKKPYATTYCDGDQPGCEWAVMENGSISSRSAYTRAGGRWITVMGPERNFPDLYMTVVGGMGVAPITNQTQPYADSPGAYYQRQKVNERIVTFTFHATHTDLSGKSCVSLQHLHALRQVLYDIIKSDKTAGDEEFLVEYQDGSYPMYIRLRYDGGLEGEWDIRNQWINSFPVRFLAVSPYFTDDNQDVAQLSFRSTLIVNGAAQRKSGVWSDMNGGFDTFIRQMAIGKRGELYAVGDFTKANYRTTAIDPQIPVNYVTYWDGIQWQKMGVGANNIVWCVAVAPNGDIYVGGAFTSIGGVACNRVAKWSSGAWSALGSGLGATVRSIAVSPNGDVYVGGLFTTAGGGNARSCARWDGSSWHSMGNYLGLNSTVFAISISKDGNTIYLGGSFTDEYGSPGVLSLLGVARYSVATNFFEQMGNGVNGIVYAMDISSSENVYIGGAFTLSGTETMLNISYWDGTRWNSLGAGMNNDVYGIDVSDDGTVIAAGNFDRAGSVDVGKVAYWNGATWLPMDVFFPNYGFGLIRDRYGNIYVGFSGSTMNYAAITLVTNPGTAEVPPKFYIVGPGELAWIENQTTKRRLYFDLTIIPSEEIFIDCATGQAISSVRGDVSYTLLSGSDIRAWKLSPGENKISCMMLHDVNASMQISFATRHWSADATERSESI